jgi:hypothetical protein
LAIHTYSPGLRSNFEPTSRNPHLLKEMALFNPS